jgi:hypothetical protein
VELWVDVTGDVELDKAIQELVDEGAKKELNQALRKACKDAVKEIVLPMVLVLIPHQYGVLESMLAVRAVKRSRYQVGYFVGFIDGSRPGQNKGSHYGWYIEFGTKPRHHKVTGKFVGEMKEDSFLRGAIYRQTDAIVAFVTERMRQWVEEANSNEV